MPHPIPAANFWKICGEVRYHIQLLLKLISFINLQQELDVTYVTFTRYYSSPGGRMSVQTKHLRIELYTCHVWYSSKLIVSPPLVFSLNDYFKCPQHFYTISVGEP